MRTTGLLAGSALLLAWSCLPTASGGAKVKGSPTAAALSVSATSTSSGEVSVSVDLIALDEDGHSYAGVMATDVSFKPPTDPNDPTGATVVGSSSGSPTCTSKRFQNAERTASVVLLMDQSGSISGTDPEDLRIIGGKEFLHSMGAGDEVMLMSFAEGNTCAGQSIVSYGSFTSNPSSVEPALDGLVGCQSGGTPLWEASVAALNALVTSGKNKNKALVVFTDGADSSFSTTLQQVIDSAKMKEIRVFTVGLSSSVEVPGLSRVAQDTGGAFFFAKDEGTMISAFRGMNLLLTGEYDRNACSQKLKLMPSSTGGSTPTSFVTTAVVEVNGVTAEAPITVQVPPPGSTSGGSAATGGTSATAGTASIAGTGGTSAGAFAAPDGGFGP